jgi:hypothetical protein
MAENHFSRQNNPTQWAKHMAFHTFAPDDAVCLLETDFPIRRIDEELGKVIKQKARKDKTTEDAVKAALIKKFGPQNVGNWLEHGTKLRITREKAIEIAFVLQMTYEETEAFLKFCWLDGFYRRDIKDVIYSHCLEKGWSYDMANEMIEGFSYLDFGNPDPEISKSFQDRLDVAEMRLTEFLSAQARSAQTKEELEEIIRQNEQYFGSFRRKQYERFMELCKQLMKELSDVAELDYVLESSLLLEEFMRDTVTEEELCDFIVIGIPEMRERGPNTLIRSLISQKIPDRPAFSEIRTKYERVTKRKSKRDGEITEVREITEVDRKLFMLVWLASEEGFINNFLISDDAEVDFIEHMEVLNDHLKAHGMAELDARHPFDWIVMNSMRCGYILDEEKKNKWIEEIDERMRALVEKM